VRLDLCLHCLVARFEPFPLGLSGSGYICLNRCT